MIKQQSTIKLSIFLLVVVLLINMVNAQSGGSVEVGVSYGGGGASYCTIDTTQDIQCQTSLQSCISSLGSISSDLHKTKNTIGIIIVVLAMLLIGWSLIDIGRYIERTSKPSRKSKINKNQGKQ